MQIMLDSTLGKILAAKQVDSSNQKEQKNVLMQANSKTESKAPEAEIRYVVKIIAEEHLVFNGKIERVKSLAREELTRLVSRIAWDGVKDSINSDVDNEVQKAKDTEVRVSKLDHRGGQSPRNAASTTNNDLNPNPTNSSADNVQEKSSTSNKKTSDHLAYIKKPTFTPQDSQRTEDIAQVKKPHEMSIGLAECDNDDSGHSPKRGRHVDEILSLQNTLLNQNSVKPAIVDEEAHSATLNDSVQNYFKEIDLNLKSNDVTFDDRQSILETLNDCLTSVDLESRNITLTDTTHPREDELSKLNNVIVEQIEPSELFNDEVIEIPFQVEEKLTNGTSDNSDLNQNSKTLNTDFNSTEDFLPIEVYNKSNSNDTVVYHGKNLTSPSSLPNLKRKSSLDKNNPSAKRVRRSTHKEYKSVKTRTSEDGKSKDRTTARQNSASEKSTSKTPSHSNQQIRQKKVFAKWSDNHFYPGTILRLVKDRKFVIGFFDGAQRNVGELDLIPLCNIEGKQVRVSIAKDYCVNAIVHDQSTPINDQPMFNVEYQQDGLVRKCVPLKDIFLTGEQGTPLINQPDKNSGASNFADVDLDNIIYEKRSRKLQEMEDFELTKNSSNIDNKSPSGKGYISVIVDF